METAPIQTLAQGHKLDTSMQQEASVATRMRSIKPTLAQQLQARWESMTSGSEMLRKATTPLLRACGRAIENNSASWISSKANCGGSTRRKLRIRSRLGGETGGLHGAVSMHAEEMTIFEDTALQMNGNVDELETHSGH